MSGDDTATWTQPELDALRDEHAAAYAGRTVLVTGADGFMGSHLTEALVHLEAKVIAFVRSTSSGALNNIADLQQSVMSTAAGCFQSAGHSIRPRRARFANDVDEVIM